MRGFLFIVGFVGFFVVCISCIKSVLFLWLDERYQHQEFTPGFRLVPMRI